MKFCGRRFIVLSILGDKLATSYISNLRSRDVKAVSYLNYKSEMSMYQRHSGPGFSSAVLDGSE